MSRTENCELTILCLLQQDDYFLLQDRVKDDWRGYTLPGGHIEPGESIVDACIREMKEETGLTIKNPHLCGIKQFPLGNTPEEGRYLVFLFTTTEFEGELTSSVEGKMHWVHRDKLPQVNTVNDFTELLQVMTDEHLNEFQYVIHENEWKVILK